MAHISPHLLSRCASFSLKCPISWWCFGWLHRVSKFYRKIASNRTRHGPSLNSQDGDHHFFTLIFLNPGNKRCHFRRRKMKGFKNSKKQMFRDIQDISFQIPSKTPLMNPSRSTSWHNGRNCLPQGACHRHFGGIGSEAHQTDASGSRCGWIPRLFVGCLEGKNDTVDSTQKKKGQQIQGKKNRKVLSDWHFGQFTKILDLFPGGPQDAIVAN